MLLAYMSKYAHMKMNNGGYHEYENVYFEPSIGIVKDEICKRLTERIFSFF